MITHGTWRGVFVLVALGAGLGLAYNTLNPKPLPWIAQARQRIPRLQVVGSSAKAEMPIEALDFNLPTLLLVGNENHGLSLAYRALCDRMAAIPMHGYASSLNIACAASIFLYEIARQRGEDA